MQISLAWPTVGEQEDTLLFGAALPGYGTDYLNPQRPIEGATSETGTLKPPRNNLDPVPFLIEPKPQAVAKGDCPVEVVFAAGTSKRRTENILVLSLSRVSRVGSR